MVNAIPRAESEIQRDVILIITDRQTDIHDITAYLDQKSFQVRMAYFDGKTVRDVPKTPPSAVLCAFDEYINPLEKIVTALKSRYAPRNIPFIGALNRAHEQIDCFDSVIYPPAHPVQIANRVNSMVRLNVMQSEISLRIDTLRHDFGITYDFSEMSFEDAFRVLFIGKATPEFMVVINALQNKNVEVVAAFTSFSAFDFLHEHEFDAVVMNALSGMEPAMTISETMRKNSKLFHVPTLFMAGPDFSAYDAAYSKGATDIIASDCTEEQISGRILELANYHRIHRQLKIEFDKIGSETCFDDSGRIYSDQFFRAHLRRACDYYPIQGQPLSLMTIRASAANDVELSEDTARKTFNELASMMKNMVRMQDAVGRLDDQIYAITFPTQERNKLETVVDRIFNVMDCTSFPHVGENKENFRIRLDVNLTQLELGENADQLLKRTLAADLAQSLPGDIDILNANDLEALLA